MRSFAALLLACALLVPSRARADDVGPSDARTRAHALYDAGVRQYNLSEFGNALDRFKSAYELHPDAALLFNIGQCHRMLGHTRDALFAYRAYLRELPNAPNRAEVERLRALMESELQKEPVAPPATAPPAAEPAPAPATVTPPAAEPAPTPPAAPVVAHEAPPKPLYKKWWLWTAVGAVVVAGVAIGVGVALAPAQNAANPGGTAGSMQVNF